MKYRKRPILTIAIADRDGDPLPVQPSLLLAEISERARIRARVARLAEAERADVAYHQGILRWLDTAARQGVAA